MLSMLGRGGMGTVYRAQHEVSHAPVAVKVLNPRFAARGEFRRWFLGEARRAGRVVHENSARVQDVGEAPDGTVYLAVEFVEGRTLREWMDGAPRLAPRWVVDVLIQIARALGAAHDAGVVHRDLSPRNVMVADSDGLPRVKILDFGIAGGVTGLETVRAGRQDPEGPTVFANPPYSAPEHLEGKPVDGRADLYSLGVLAFEALTGSLPVAGEGADELALATRQRSPRRMPGVAGVPATLRRLIDELLEGEPVDRPPDAHLVAERLVRIRAGSGRLFGSTALAVAALATTLFAWAFAPQRQSTFLFGLPVPGALRIVSQPPGGSEATQVLRTADLLSSRFEMRGMRLSRLGLRVLRHGVERGRVDLGPMLQETNGVVQFRPEATAGLQLLLRRASLEGPVDLVFTAGDQQPVAYARCRLDDDPPRVVATLEASDVPESLRGELRLRFQAEDTVALEEIALTVEVLGGATAAQLVRIPVPEFAAGSTTCRGESTLRELMAGSFRGVRQIGRVRLRLDVADAAGFRTPVVLSDWQWLDLAAPAVIGVEGEAGRALIIERAGVAEASVLVAEPEPELQVQCYGPEGAEWLDCRVLARRESRLAVELPGPEAGGPPSSGDWRFRVVDVAGNRGDELLVPLEVRSAATAAEVRIESTSTPRIARIEELFYSDGRSCSLQFSCNSLYRPGRLRIRRSGGEWVHEAELEDATAGAAILPMPELPDGRYEFEVELEGARDAALPAQKPYELLVRNEAPRLELPGGPGTADFLPELEDLGMLRFDEGRVAQGPSWRLVPPDPRLLRGSILVGSNGGWSTLDYRVDGSERGEILPPVALGRGEGALGLALRDVLDRPLDVRVQQTPLPGEEVAGHANAVVVARFLYHDAPFEPADAVSLVEHGEPVAVAVRVAVALGTRADEVMLATSGNSIAPVHTQGMDEAGGVLEFRVPFAQAVLGTDLEGLGEEDFAGGRAATLRVSLRSPLGTYPLEIELRTIRTTLLPVSVRDRWPRIPAACASLRLVPVTGPGLSRSFPDPVPADIPRRDGFRAGPSLEVRNLGDFLLQDRELTGGEYLALAEEGLECWRALEDSPAWVARLVHGFDPMQADRLSSSGLRPVHHADDDAWRRAARVGPERDRPVFGLSDFQAECVARLAGLLAAADPSLFRLPFGVELEVAAFGNGVAGVQGAEVSGTGIDRRLFSQWSHRIDSGSWPPNAAEATALGDVVVTPLGHRILGLDSGVREWVADLPYFVGDLDSEALLREWMADHVRHRQRVAELFSRSGAVRLPQDLLGRLATFGVLRGIGAGEARALQLDANGVTILPGVVRCLQVRRDGTGFPSGRPDPHAERAGMRLAGGAHLVEALRK